MQVTQTKENPKYHQVYKQLINELSGNRFRPGEKLPSERDFAERLDVNVRTVRRAFRDLVLGGIVEKRIGSGTYLKIKLDSSWHDRAINVVLENTYDGTVQHMIEMAARKVSERRNRKYRIIFTDREELPKLLKSCVNYRQPTILCLNNLDGISKVFDAPELFVAFSSMIYQDGIPCIQCDDTKGIRMLIEHLHSLGHKRIAFLRQEDKAGDGLAERQSAVWTSALGTDFDSDLKLMIDDVPGYFMEHAFNTVSKALKQTEFSALICATDELMYGATAALREAGKRIPEDVSVVSIGNTPLSWYASPPITCYDPDIESHIEQAIDMLDFNHENPDKIEKLRLVDPELIVRKSTTNYIGD